MEEKDEVKEKRVRKRSRKRYCIRRRKKRQWK